MRTAGVAVNQDQRLGLRANAPGSRMEQPGRTPEGVVRIGTDPRASIGTDVQECEGMTNVDWVGMTHVRKITPNV